MEMEEDAEQRATDENIAKQNNIDADKVTTMEMRKRAMGSMGETRERMRESDKGKKIRSDGMYALEKAIETKQQIDKKERDARAGERQKQLMMQEVFLEQLKASQQQAVQFKVLMKRNFLQQFSYCIGKIS